MAVGDAPADKRALRRRVRSAVAALEPAARAAADARIADRLRAVLPSDGDVLAYAALPDEVDLATTLAWLAAAGRLCLPRLDGDAMTATRVHDLSALRAGPHGILEPAGDAAATPVAVVVPGRAFDVGGGRLGRGGGTYDRWLAARPGALRVGVAYEAQVVDPVPMDPHDQRMHLLVTEAGVRDLRPVEGP
ncbi:MAG: 5-formyltetrahydrofolate cyclo-ligase [Alphaproteobacteria bacterium]|nr:5-formyltetrahydrofolate cyclo-ligase [Alphaproteobacteria bacterium]